MLLVQMLSFIKESPASYHDVCDFNDCFILKLFLPYVLFTYTSFGILVQYFYTNLSVFHIGDMYFCSNFFVLFLEHV